MYSCYKLTKGFGLCIPFCLSFFSSLLSPSTRLPGPTARMSTAGSDIPPRGSVSAAGNRRSQGFSDKTKANLHLKGRTPHTLHPHRLFNMFINPIMMNALTTYNNKYRVLICCVLGWIMILWVLFYCSEKLAKLLCDQINILTTVSGYDAEPLAGNAALKQLCSLRRIKINQSQLLELPLQLVCRRFLCIFKPL